MSLPSAYAHLQYDSNSRMLREAVNLYGVKEKQGSGNNPVILDWAKEVERETGKPLGYNADSIPWCGLFAAVCAVRADWPIPLTPLWARSWADFGAKANRPSVGDVLVFSRDGGGHVGFYAAEEPGYFHVLGGNQGDAVSITRVAKSRLLAARRPRWRISQPLGVRPYWMRDGHAVPVSANEA